MDRQAIKRDFPLGMENTKRGVYYDPVTAAIVVGATATTYQAVESRKSRKEQAAANTRAEEQARAAQAEQESLAQEEQRAADIKLEEQRARILKGQKGRGSLLFGSELGTEEKATTLGG